MSEKRQASKYWIWGVVLLILAVTAVLRIRLLEVPLERDEGGYAYTAQLILQGVPPFAVTYDIKMPGLYYVYALILLIFGQTTAGIHLGLLVFNAATIVVIFLLVRHLFDPTAGVVAAASYATMSLSWPVLGFSANAEQLLLLPALSGIFLMLCAIEAARLRTFFVSGLLLGAALVTKHQGVFFAGFAGLYLFLSYLKKPLNLWKRYLFEYIIFVVGMVIPFCILCIMFLCYGLFDKFFFWLFEYAKAYSSSVSFSTGLELLKKHVPIIARVFLFFWMLSLLGLTALVWHRRTRKQVLFAALFFLFSFLSLVPGYRFFPHYFVLILPCTVLLAGAGVSSITEVLSSHKVEIIKKGLPILLTAGAVTYSVFVERVYLFKMSPNKICRASYGRNPFTESVEIADYIKGHSSPDDYIAILGSEPQICFYAGRRSASAYIYIYPLMALHKYARHMHEEVIGEIETAQPKFLVYVKIRTSWLAKPDSENLIFEWAQDYIKKYYQPVGVIDLPESGPTIYLWGEEASSYSTGTEYWIRVYQRK